MNYPPQIRPPGPPPFKRSGPWWVWPLILVGIAGFLIVWSSQMHVGEFGMVVILCAAAVVAFIALIVRALIRVGDKQPPAVIQPPGPPPGWYVDPAGLTRWYDGRQWTEHVQPGAYPQREGQS